MRKTRERGAPRDPNEPVTLQTAQVQARLKDLKLRIERDFGVRNVYFYKSVPETGIAGYWGEGPVAFIAERPSRPPTGRDGATRRFSNAFFDALKRHHLEGSHLTDLMKHFPGTGLSRAERINRNWPYLMEELAIIDAKIVVAVGSAVFSVLKRRLAAEPFLMPHYSYRFGSSDDLQKRIDAALERVARARIVLNG